eukprot:jgi/Psemu1/224048/e_gw1.1420.3.1
MNIERPDSVQGVLNAGCDCGTKQISGKSDAAPENKSTSHVDWAPIRRVTQEKGPVADPVLRQAKKKREIARDIAHNLASTVKKESRLKEYHDKRSRRLFLPWTEFVARDDFIDKFEALGVPFEISEKKDNDRVMILYSDSSAFPDAEAIVKGKKDVFLSVDDATKNCHNLHVVLTNYHRKNQCIALLGQYESFHLHKFMRASPQPEKPSNRDKFIVNASYPLRPVNRNMRADGGKAIHVPKLDDLKTNWNNLAPYLQTLEATLEKLKPIAESVAKHNDNNTIVIMVCNFGQSELLSNFVCHARAKGLEKDLSSILIFSTDKETHELATNILGLTSFYSEDIFGKIPKKAADGYADGTFREIMFAKVYCVHMISMLGYDLLFQDVDVLWYKNPLAWFHGGTNAVNDYDMIFQDDGSRVLMYAPYAANTGFYFVRNNERTRIFFNSLLMAGDLIMASFSHQIALVALVSEHVSLYGLRVKVWNRSLKEFPGGYMYHEAPDLVKKLIKGETQPYIFHMCWTENKDDKVKYMQQMGQWYLQDSCRNKSKKKIHDSAVNGTTGVGQQCCSSKSLITCHYRDKPSIIPCPDSPPIDKGAKSFW